MKTPDITIRATALGKSYRLDQAFDRHRTLRDTLADAARRFTQPRTPAETFWALQDVSFEVRAGEAVGLIGRNGSGKSTLLKILSRVTAPTAGRAELRGRVGSLLEVGTGFHPELTGRDNVFLNGAVLGMRRSEIMRNFDAIVAFAEVEHFIDTPVKRYSSGMYLRLAFAVAAHLEPEILFVDEVLAVGDAEFQKKCLGKMGEVARHGRTVVFVSHNMAAIQGLCERAIWLDSGRLVQEGSSRAVVSAYLRTAHEKLGFRAWDDPADAPGNDKVRMRRIAVVREDGGDGSIDIHTPFRVEIEYWNLVPNAKLNLSLHLFNEHNVIVFNAVPVAETTWQGRAFPAGLFRDVCHIPGDLLNDGTYWIELLVVHDDTRVVFQDDEAIVFTVEDTLAGRGSWHGRWAGAVRPRLAWETELLAAGEPAPVAGTAAAVTRADAPR